MIKVPSFIIAGHRSFTERGEVHIRSIAWRVSGGVLDSLSVHQIIDMRG